MADEDVQTSPATPTTARARVLEVENLTLRFAYPTGVSRPYMPTPEDTFQVLKSQLEAAGITVTPVSAKWSPDYLDMAQTEAGSKKRDIHLLGWTGDYNDPDNFLGVFFGAKGFEWNFDNKELFADLKAARDAFAALSDAVIAAGNAEGWQDVGEVKLAYCPMVKRSWLQKDQAQIRNPYYGSQMLTCGEFKPTAK